MSETRDPLSRFATPETSSVEAAPAQNRAHAAGIQRKLQRRLAQRKAAAEGDAGMSVHDAAEHGTSGAGGALPHQAQIQAAFGRHDVGGITAHTDGAASAGARAMGAQAYAAGNHVAFDGAPSLHTAAHEAAHVIQQRAGVHLKGGVGEVGDSYEQHADAVADRVVAGQSAEGLLDQYAPSGGGHASPAGAPVQRLALRYGNAAPIPEDAQMLAAHQNNTRGTPIAVQPVSNGGGVAIDGQVYKDMAAGEDVYLVAHGRPPLGDKPAVLEASGGGPTIGGSQVASIFNTIRSGMTAEHKAIGEFKIEACMSALSRKTTNGIFGGAFVKESPSLLQDTKASLAKDYNVKDITLKGNLGFSAGSELDGGVENTTPEGTEIGLLDPLANDIRGLPDVKAREPKVADALNIIAKQSALLATADKDKPMLKELHTASTTAAFLKSSFEGLKVDPKAVSYDLENVLTVLVGYIKSKATKT